MAAAEFHFGTTAAFKGNDTRFEVRQRVLGHQCADHDGVQSNTVDLHGRESVIKIGYFSICRVRMYMNTFFLRFLRGPNDSGVRTPDLYAAGIIALPERKDLWRWNRLSRKKP